MRDQSPYSKHRQIPFTNSSGEIIPAFGVVEITGASIDGVLTVVKPTDTAKNFLLAVNGHHDVAIGEKGSLVYHNPAFVLYDDADTPANGERWKSKPNTFEMELITPETGQFMILGGEDGDKVFAAPPHCNCSESVPPCGECSSMPECFTVTFSGFTDAGDCDKCTTLNDTFILHDVGNCTWQFDTGFLACAFYRVGLRFVPGLPGLGRWLLTLLRFGSFNPIYTWELAEADFDCFVPNVMDIETPISTFCTTPPATVTVEDTVC